MAQVNGFERDEITMSDADVSPDISTADELRSQNEELKKKIAARETSELDGDVYSSGKPSLLPKEKLMTSEGIIPVQSGTNKYASQAGITGFGRPRDVLGHEKDGEVIKKVDEEKARSTHGYIRLQSGTNRFCSQQGMTMGAPRDVMYKSRGMGGSKEVEEDKQRLTDGIIRLQSGTNKLASQSGQTAFGAPRGLLSSQQVFAQDPESQGFIHLQMGTNTKASQAGMTGYGMPRWNVSKSIDTTRGDIPYDESTMSRQNMGCIRGPNTTQSGMRMGGFRNNTLPIATHIDQKSQGIVHYQMGVNWTETQSGQTGFGVPRQVTHEVTDLTHPDLPDALTRSPALPMWSSGFGQHRVTQRGMSAMGSHRDVKGKMVRRLY